MPEAEGDTTELEGLERGLMYVAMTRAEDRLLITGSSNTGFAQEISQLLSA